MNNKNFELELTYVTKRFVRVYARNLTEARDTAVLADFDELTDIAAQETTLIDIQRDNLNKFEISDLDHNH